MIPFLLRPPMQPQTQNKAMKFYQALAGLILLFPIAIVGQTTTTEPEGRALQRVDGEVCGSDFLSAIPGEGLCDGPIGTSIVFSMVAGRTYTFR
jgi:hypothetical protein